MTINNLQAGDWVYAALPLRPRDKLGALVKLTRVAGTSAFATLRGRTIEIESKSLAACTVSRDGVRMIFRP